MNNVKILLIHTADYLHHKQPSRQHAIFELLAERHEVYVLHFHVSRGAERATRVHMIEATRYDTQNPVLHYTMNALHHYQTISGLIREKGIDVIVTTNVLASTAAIMAARNQNVPVIFDLSDWLPDSAAAYVNGKYLKEIVRTVVFWITRWNLGHSTTVLTVSPSLKKRLHRMGIPATIITNGVDTRVFRPIDKATAKRALGLSDSFVIGFAGAMEEWYDVESMIRAMPKLLKQYPDTKLLLVGGSLFTQNEQQLKTVVSELRLDGIVLFTGFQPYEKLPEYIGAMDLCTIPLKPKEWIEIALPNKYFEYSAMGKPILMTPIPGIMEVGEDLFIYQDEETYLKNIDLFRKLNYTERRKVQENSWENKAIQFDVVIREVTMK